MMGEMKHHMEAEKPQDIYNGKIVLTSVIDMDIGITKMSSKGQVVIPAEMRGDIKEGEKLVIIKNGQQLILKKASDLDKTLEGDLEFAKRTEEAWKSYEQGEFKTMDSKRFLKELEKW